MKFSSHTPVLETFPFPKSSPCSQTQSWPTWGHLCHTLGHSGVPWQAMPRCLLDVDNSPTPQKNPRKQLKTQQKHPNNPHTCFFPLFIQHSGPPRIALNLGELQYLWCSQNSPTDWWMHLTLIFVRTGQPVVRQHVEFLVCKQNQKLFLPRRIWKIRTWYSWN